LFPSKKDAVDAFEPKRQHEAPSAACCCQQIFLSETLRELATSNGHSPFAILII
jgi:hypothetical protein